MNINSINHEESLIYNKLLAETLDNKITSKTHTILNNSRN